MYGGLPIPKSNPSMFQYELISNLRVSPVYEFNLHSYSPVDYNINSHI